MAQVMRPERPVPRTIGDRIVLLLRHRGWQLGDLSEVTGIPIGTLSKYANDVTRPPYERLIAIARAFEVSTDDLLGLDRDTPDELGRQSRSVLAPAAA